MQSQLEEIIKKIRNQPPRGEVAKYIPELANVDPDLAAIAVMDLEGNRYQAGDFEHSFTMQSVSKAFALALALKTYGSEVFKNVGYEPTGNPFFSMLPLESEQGKPRNPFVNSGAIAVSGMLPGSNQNESYHSFLDFLHGVCSTGDFKMDGATYSSESSTGFRNRAMANFLRQYGWIDDVEAAVETYFMQCSTLTNVGQLARLGLFLANRGTDPVTGEQILDEDSCRSIVTLMTTCGTYDYAGRVAIEIGLPCKSGVSGAMLAIVPGKMSIATFSPRLGDHGNSEAGMEMLQLLSESMELSIFQ